MKFINWLRIFYQQTAIVGKPVYEQSHAEFAFLLDLCSGWKKSYGEGGLIQYQSFVPKESAEKSISSADRDVSGSEVAVISGSF